MIQQGLISWDEHLKMAQNQTRERWKPTAISCPMCMRALYKDTMVVLTSDPPKSQFMCKCCGWWGVG